MRRLSALTAVTILALNGSVGAATLNKCIDAQGKITYSNLPCRDALEAHKLEIDPAPLPERAPAQSSQKPSTSSKPAQWQNVTPLPEAAPPAKGSAPGKSATRASARECDSLSDKLGRVLDKMDQAHRKGYTQEQMDKWNQEVKNLESKKQQSGCF